MIDHTTFQLDAVLELDGYAYLATPYSKYADGIEAAAIEARRAMMWLRRQGVKVYSPIVWTHEIAWETGIDPVDCDFWLQVDRPLMERASCLIVVKMPGWQESRGVAVEIEYFKSAGKPVFYLEHEA